MRGRRREARRVDMGMRGRFDGCVFCTFVCFGVTVTLRWDGMAETWVGGIWCTGVRFREVGGGEGGGRWLDGWDGWLGEMARKRGEDVGIEGWGLKGDGASWGWEREVRGGVVWW